MIVKTHPASTKLLTATDLYASIEFCCAASHPSPETGGLQWNGGVN